MPIEFRCPQCQKLLRVGDDAAGKQAKCPACATLVAVPTLGPPPADEFAIEPPSPPPPPPAGSPFGTAGTNPFASAPMPQRLAPASDNPYAAPLSGADNASSSPFSSGVIRPTQISVNSVFEVMWPVFKANMGMLIAVFFVEWIIGQAFNYGGAIAAAGMQVGGADRIFVGLLQVFHGLANAVIAIWLASGRDLFYFETAQGMSPPFSRLFGGHVLLLKRFLFSLLGGLVGLLLFSPAIIVGLAVGVGGNDEEAGLIAGLVTAAVCFVPWVWVALTYGQAWYVYLDQSVGVIEGIRISGRITPGNRLSLFAIGILGGLMFLAGACACLVGMFFTGPMFYMLSIIAFMQMTGQPIHGYDSTVPSHMTM